VRSVTSSCPTSIRSNPAQVKPRRLICNDPYSIWDRRFTQQWASRLQSSGIWRSVRVWQIGETADSIFRIVLSIRCHTPEYGNCIIIILADVPLSHSTANYNPSSLLARLHKFIRIVTCLASLFQVEDFPINSSKTLVLIYQTKWIIN
jgi:hypothetical protein